MLGSFIAHGLTQGEAGSESLLQMSVSDLVSHLILTKVASRVQTQLQRQSALQCCT